MRAPGQRADARRRGAAWVGEHAARPLWCGAGPITNNDFDNIRQVPLFSSGAHETKRRVHFFCTGRGVIRAQASGGPALIAAMGAALDYLTAQGDGDLVAGRNKLVANAELCAECTRAGVQALGFELFSSSPSAAVTAVKAPEGISATDIVKGFNVTRERIDSLNPDLPGRDWTIGLVLLGDACSPYTVSSETD